MRRAPAARSFEYWLHSAKHAWRPSLFSTVLSPVLYLAALGVGLGALVDRGDPSGLGGVAYLTFVAPGLLAATAMQIAAGEAGGPVRGAFQFTKAYHAMLATPLDVRDVLHGHLLWILFRVAASCAIYAAVMAAFGAFQSPWAVLALRGPGPRAQPGHGRRRRGAPARRLPRPVARRGAGRRRSHLPPPAPGVTVSARAFLLVERNFVVYRRAWIIIASGF